MEDQRVGRDRPLLLRQGVAQLLLDHDRVVSFCDADAVGHAEYVAIDRKPGHAERVAEDDVRGLAADAGKRGEGLHRRRNLAAVLLVHGGRHSEE